VRQHPLHTRLRGAFIAPITPMHEDGRVNGGAVAELTRFILAAGLEGHGGLLPVSSTGEFMSLSESEYDEVVGETVEAAAGTVPVIAGANHMDTAGAVDRARRAQRLGADGVLAGPPFYFRPTREEVIDHFRRISGAVEIGVLVYDNTFATQLDLDEDLFAALAELPNVVGTKDGTMDVFAFDRIRRRVGDQIAILSAPGEWNEPAARLGGAAGFVSVLGTLAPELTVGLERLVRAGDHAAAAAMAQRIRPLMTAIEPDGGGTYISALKAGLQLRGIAAGPVRPPLRALHEGEMAALEIALREVGLAAVARGALA